MSYFLPGLMNFVAYGLLCVATGYLIGKIRGRKKTREQIMGEASYRIYNHDS